MYLLFADLYVSWYGKFCNILTLTSILFKEINTFSLQQQFIKSDSKYINDFYKVINNHILNKCCSFELYIHQITQQILSSTTVFSSDNKKCFLSSQSALSITAINYMFKYIQIKLKVIIFEQYFKILRFFFHNITVFLIK